MTKEQANKALYLVALFALLSILSILFTLPIVWAVVMKMSVILLYSILGSVMLLILIWAPFARKNIFLIAVPILFYLEDIPSRIQGIYGYFIGTDVLVNEGIVPGIFIYSVFVLTCLSGLVILLLRCYGYIKEHKAGLKTQF